MKSSENAGESERRGGCASGEGGGVGKGRVQQRQGQFTSEEPSPLVLAAAYRAPGSYSSTDQSATLREYQISSASLSFRAKVKPEPE